MSKRKSLARPIMVFLLIVLLALIAWSYLRTNTNGNDSGKNLPTSFKVASLFDGKDRCDYGFEPVAKYFDTYKVRKGDTFLAIAKNELGGKVRFNEIIEINKARYTFLEKNPTFLEVGMELYLPKKEWPPSSGTHFSVAKGRILDIQSDKLTLLTLPPDEEYRDASFRVTSAAVFKGKKRAEYKIHDCVILIEARKSIDPGVLQVSLQDI